MFDFEDPADCCEVIGKAAQAVNAFGRVGDDTAAIKNAAGVTNVL